MPKKIFKIMIIALVILILFMFFFKFFIIVEPGERAIIFNRVTGTLKVIDKEGFYPLVPVLWKPTIYDIRIRTYTMSDKQEGERRSDNSLEVLTSDGQKVFLDISIRFHPDPEKLNLLDHDIGPDYVELVVRPQVRTIVRMTVSGYQVESVFSSKRREIQDNIFRELGKELAKSYIILDAVMLRNVRFSDEYQKAIEAKQIAQQENERMQYVVEKQNERRVSEARAEAEALSLKGKALQENPSLIQYEYVKLLAPNIQAIVTDHNAIFNFPEFLKGQKK